MAARKDLLFAYLVVSLTTGVRTEEARALRWDHVDLDGDDRTPPHVDVFRSVRAHGDVKTRTSRRTLALPAVAVAALTEHREKQKIAGIWSPDGLVFTTRNGTVLDAHNVRRSFRRICTAAGIGDKWSPRELRHSFVSIMSEHGVPIEQIAGLVGHAGGSRVTELVYRQRTRPVLVNGAEVMDTVFGTPRKRRRVVRPGAASGVIVTLDNLGTAQVVRRCRGEIIILRARRATVRQLPATGATVRVDVVPAGAQVRRGTA
jgi:hypothetical protein